jgi:pilus assembly protein CpaD
MTVMSRIPLLFALGLTGFAATGCTSPPLNNDERHYYDAAQQFPISVEPQVQTLAVHVDGDLNSLARGEAERISVFAQRWRSRGHGLVNVATPAGAEGDGALAQVKKVLAANGVDKAAVQFTTYTAPGGDGAAPITLSYVAYAASAPECGGDWSRNLSFDPRNTMRPDFGCSTQHNFAAMVANPHDLIEPAASASADAQRKAIVIEKYQRGEATQSTRNMQYESGRSSTVNPN